MTTLEIDLFWTKRVYHTVFLTNWRGCSPYRENRLNQKIVRKQRDLQESKRAALKKQKKRDKDILFSSSLAQSIALLLHTDILYTGRIVDNIKIN